MLPLPNVTFTVTSNNLNRLEPDADNVAGLILGLIDFAPSLPDGTITVLYSLAQAEALGLTEANDASAEVAAWIHIADFFRENPNGELHLLVKETELTPDDVFKLPNALALDFVRSANGRIKQLGVVFNNDALRPTFMAGINSHVQLAQNMCDECAKEYKWLDVVFMEALGFDQDVASITELREADRPNVAVVVGNDKNWVSQSTSYPGTQPIGAILGVSTNKEIHESFAEAKTDNTITDVAANRFLDVVIKQTGQDIYKDNPANQSALYTAGYIFPRQFANRSGWYWVQSTNLSLPTSDLSSIELVQVINKAQRVLYNTLLKYINKNVDVNAQGRLTFLEKEGIRNDVITELDNNLANNYSDLVSVIVDPEKDENNQPYPSIQVDSTLRVLVGIRAKGKLIYIAVNVGYLN